MGCDAENNIGNVKKRKAKRKKKKIRMKKPLQEDKGIMKDYSTLCHPSHMPK
jgi:hypothetical protein